LKIFFLTKKTFLMFISITISLNINVIYAQSLNVDDIFTVEQKTLVLTGEFISRMYLKHNPVGENTDIRIQIPITKYTSEDYSNYEMICDERAFIPYKLDSKTRLSVYNTLLGFSKLKGTEYWTFNGNKKVTFIVDSSTIDDRKKRNSIPDYESFLVENYRKSYFQQMDNKFGKLVYINDLFVDGDNFVSISSTADPIFPIVRAGEFKSIIFLMYDDKNSGFFYYAASVMRIRNDLILKSGKLYNTTFSNRLRGANIHLFKLLGVDRSDKIVTWDTKKLKEGYYRNF